MFDYDVISTVAIDIVTCLAIGAGIIVLSIIGCDSDPTGPQLDGEGNGSVNCWPDFYFYSRW